MYARSIAAIGLTDGHPAKLTLEDGHLAHATGPEGEQLLGILREHGDAGTNLAELGVGTNDRATLTGQRPRGREDPRHASTSRSARASRSAARSPSRSTSTASSPRRRSTIDGTRVLDEGRFVLAA